MQQHHKDFSICNIKMLALKIVIIASVANLTKLEKDKAERGTWIGRKYGKEFIGNVKIQPELARIVISRSNWLKGGDTFTAFAILVRKTTSTTSENERLPEVMRSLSSLYANDVLRVLIFDEEQITSHSTDSKNWKVAILLFYFFFTRKNFFFWTFKKRFFS